MLARTVTAIVIVALLAGASCYDPHFPTTLTLLLDSATQLSVEAPIHSGVSSLANSTWAVYTEDPDAPVERGNDGLPPGPGRPELVVRVQFGPSGEIVCMYDNRFERDTIPETIQPDGQLHPSELIGASYVGAPYGGQIDDAAAAAGLARLVAGPIELASATIYIRGTLADDRWNGVLGYQLTIPPGAGAFDPTYDAGQWSYEYAMYAVRE
ncbi:MAG TPA: hypothetical protein VMV94_01745 [Phycisphaerae bacterium]|nr:hypothetical protein [Phycisphaerae bacterium]